MFLVGQLFQNFDVSLKIKKCGWRTHQLTAQILCLFQRHNQLLWSMLDLPLLTHILLLNHFLVMFKWKEKVKCQVKYDCGQTDYSWSKKNKNIGRDISQMETWLNVENYKSIERNLLTLKVSIPITKSQVSAKTQLKIPERPVAAPVRDDA